LPLFLFKKFARRTMGGGSLLLVCWNDVSYWKPRALNRFLGVDALVSVAWTIRVIVGGSIRNVSIGFLLRSQRAELAVATISITSSRRRSTRSILLLVLGTLLLVVILSVVRIVHTFHVVAPLILILCLLQVLGDSRYSLRRTKCKQQLVIFRDDFAHKALFLRISMMDSNLLSFSA
jgi:hypothetical protein